MREVYVIGIGCTPVGEHWGEGLRELAAEAALKALDEARVDRLDHLYVSNMMGNNLQGQGHLGAVVADQIGFTGIAAHRVEAACGSGGVALHQAWSAVAGGMEEVALVVGVEKMSDSSTEEVTCALVDAEDRDFVGSVGITFAGLNALAAQLYMMRYGATSRQLAAFSANAHRNGAYNPNALFKTPYTVDDVLASPLVADPLRRLDCSGVGDGAAAIVLASEEASKHCPEDAVRLRSCAVAVDLLSIHEREDPLTMSAIVNASRRAYALAGIGPEDIDLVEVHDAFTIMAALSLEDMGFVPKGEAARFASEGNIGIDGRLPTCTMGGLKARGHPIGATGIYQALEVVQQLREQAGKNQVRDPEVGVAENVGGAGGTAAVSVFTRR